MLGRASSELFGHNTNIGDDELPSSIGSIPLGLEARSILLGNSFTCVLMVDDSLKCWGINYNGGMGQGHTRPVTTPVTISLGVGVTDFSLGGSSVYVLLEDGSVRSWGDNGSGQLGLGHTNSIGDNESIYIVDPPLLGGEGSPIIARFTHDRDTRASQAIRFDASGSYFNSPIGSYSWNFGDGGSAQLGEVVSHTFSGSGSYQVTLTVMDSLGQSDTFTRTIHVKMPNRPPFFVNPTESFTVYQGETAVLELMNAEDHDQNTNLTYTLVESPSLGTLSNCLGGSADLICDYVPDSSSLDSVQFTYKANDGESDSQDVFTVFLDVRAAGTRILQRSLGRAHTCVLYENKKVSCWGDNKFGQLGYKPSKTEVLGKHKRSDSQKFKLNPYAEDFKFVNLDEDVIQVSAGGDSTCVLLDGGGVRCWGSNSHGQLGLESKNIVDASVVKDLPLGERAKFVDIGSSHTCAVLIDGQMKCWGDNSFGQLGQGHNMPLGVGEKLSQLPVIELSDKVNSIAVGDLSTCVVLENQNALCWGHRDYHGQKGLSEHIGDDENLLGLAPLPLGGDVSKIEFSENGFCASLDESSVRCWGEGQKLKLSK